jgi:hypothetical protein
MPAKITEGLRIRFAGLNCSDNTRIAEGYAEKAFAGSIRSALNYMFSKKLLPCRNHFYEEILAVLMIRMVQLISKIYGFRRINAKIGSKINFAI